MHILCMQPMQTKVQATTKTDPKVKEFHRIVKHLRYEDNISQDEIDYDLEKLEKLLQRGTDINGRNRHGETPLHFYIREDEWETNLDPQVIKFLLKNGSEINTESNDNHLVIDMLINSHVTSKIVNLFLTYGLNASQKINNNPLLNIYIKRNRNPRLEIIKHMIENGANINEKDSHGETPLMLYFIESNNIDYDTIIYILEQGANITEKDRNGKSVLEYALRSTHITYKIIYLLLANGAPINFKNIKTILQTTNTMHQSIKTLLATIFHMNSNIINHTFLPTLIKLVEKAQIEDRAKRMCKNFTFLYSCMSIANVIFNKKATLEKSIFAAFFHTREIKDFMSKMFHIISYRNFYDFAQKFILRSGLPVAKSLRAKMLISKEIYTKRMLKTRSKKVKRKKVTVTTPPTEATQKSLVKQIHSTTADQAIPNITITGQKRKRPEKANTPNKRRKFLKQFVLIETQDDN